MIIKVCGMRDPDNIREVEALGIDWMGFIFYKDSPRYVGDEVPSYLPKACRRVGVFVNSTIKEIAEKVDSFGLDVVQLHGKESPEYCRNLSNLVPQVLIVKAFSIEDQEDFRKVKPYGRVTAYYLFDAPTPLYGGSGSYADWEVLEKYRGKTPFILSGGIGPDSLDDLDKFYNPMWRGIDLNSRFEIEPGIKDVEKLRKFLEQKRERDAQYQ